MPFNVFGMDGVIRTRPATENAHMVAIIAPEWTAAEKHNANLTGAEKLLDQRIVPFYRRTGYEVQDTVYADGKKRYIRVEKFCKRCGGKGGSEAWKHTGFTCYECGGTGGRYIDTEYVYTADQLAKMNARQDAARAKRQAAADAKAAEALLNFKTTYADLLAKIQQVKSPSDFILKVLEKGEKYGTLSDRQVEALNSAAEKALARQQADEGSTWLGKVGDRITFTATITFVTGFDTQFGYTTVTGLRDDDGNMIVQKGVSIGDKGDRLTVTATVKEHGERNGVKQTIISRPKIK